MTDVWKGHVSSYSGMGKIYAEEAEQKVFEESIQFLKKGLRH